MKKGSLTVVGTGYVAAGHVTAEAEAAIRSAEKCVYVVGDSVTAIWLRKLNATAESLRDAYAAGKPRKTSYAEIVQRILAPVRAGLDVCAAFYGHPGVFVNPSHEAVTQARAEGFEARMLPGISAEDCLFADLGFDPGVTGCQSFEATDFLVRRRKWDPASTLVLWQAGAIGVATYEEKLLWNREGLRVLTDVLLEHYPGDQEVVLYEAAIYPVCAPAILRVRLRGLPEAAVSVNATLCLRPAREAPLDAEMLDRLGMRPPGA